MVRPERAGASRRSAFYREGGRGLDARSAPRVQRVRCYRRRCACYSQRLIMALATRMETCSIVAAGPDRVSDVQHLAQRIWRIHYPPLIGAEQTEYMLLRMYSEPALQRFVAEHGAGLAIAERGDRAEGFAAWYRSGPTTTKLDKLYVLPERHRRGIGRALLAHVAAQARGAGDAVLMLNVNRRNAQAIAFYEREGFAITGRGDFPIGGGFVMEDFIMARPL